MLKFHSAYQGAKPKGSLEKIYIYQLLITILQNLFL